MRLARIITIASLLLMVCSYVLVLLFFPGLLPQPREIVATLQQAGPIAPIIFILLSVARGLLLFPPIFTMNIMSGIVFGPIYGAIYAIIGGVLCAQLQFGLARLFGQPLIGQLVGPKRKLPDVTPFTTLSSMILLRLVMIGVPFDLVNLGLGLTKATWRDYLLATSIGLIPGVILATQFSQAVEQPPSSGIVAATVLVTGVATVTLAYRYRKYRRIVQTHWGES